MKPNDFIKSNLKEALIKELNMKPEIALYFVKYPRLFFWDKTIDLMAKNMDWTTANECCELLSTYCENSKGFDLTSIIKEISPLL